MGRTSDRLKEVFEPQTVAEEIKDLQGEATDWKRTGNHACPSSGLQFGHHDRRRDRSRKGKTVAVYRRNEDGVMVKVDHNSRKLTGK